jgi:hypothetical protein
LVAVLANQSLVRCVQRTLLDSCGLSDTSVSPRTVEKERSCEPLDSGSIGPSGGEYHARGRICLVDKCAVRAVFSQVNT